MGATMVKRLLLASLLGLSASTCTDQRSHTQAVYMLVDTSGTYAQEVGKAQRIINYLLGTLQSGDSLAVARVKTRSFSEKDIIAKVTFDSRPSQANAQDRKSTRLNSSHVRISYAVFCLKKKNTACKSVAGTGSTQLYKSPADR